MAKKKQEEPMIGLVGKKKKIVPIEINMDSLGRSSADIEAGAHAYTEWLLSLSEEDMNEMLAEASRRFRAQFDDKKLESGGFTKEEMELHIKKVNAFMG